MTVVLHHEADSHRGLDRASVLKSSQSGNKLGSPIDIGLRVMTSYCVDHLVPMNVFMSQHPIIVDMIYAKPDHKDNKFKGLYSPRASILWVDRDLAAIVLVAADLANSFFNWRLKLNDCLRTVEAQEQMANYGFHPSLVSKPGSGSHPRAMAIDIEPVTMAGSPIDMGTSFDDFAVNPALDNPAARNYTKGWRHSETFDLEIWLNRQRLEYIMRRAAVICGHILFPLREEWWDFRMMTEAWSCFKPLREEDLHGYQRLRQIDDDSKKLMNAIEAFTPGFPGSLDEKVPPQVKYAVQYVSERLATVRLPTKLRYTK